jgi:hypothetical protein
MKKILTFSLFFFLFALPTANVNAESIPVASTTTIPLVASTTTTTVALTTTTTVAPTTTTTLPRWRNYCIAWNLYNWYEQTFDSLYYTYPASAVYPVPSGGCSSLNTSPSYCPVAGFFQSQSDLTVYDALKKVTNHRSGSYNITGWNCKTNSFSGLQIEDNFGITTQTTIWFDFKFPMDVANCWRIKHIYESGEGEWSNKVCYTPPPVPQTTVPSYVPITLPSYTSYAPATVAPYTYNTFVRTGAICFDGWRSKATGSGACSWHGGVSKWLGYNYSTYKSPSSSYGTSTYKLPSLSHGSSNCVGMCHGSPSKVNGLPRNSYVSGYLKSNGTWVNGYTRSKP